MGSWVVVAAYFVAPVTALALLVRLLSGPASSGPETRVRSWWQHRPRRRRAPAPAGRPIEEIAHDARRLGRQLRHADDGRSAARITAIRRSYDDVLSEGCTALGVTHLLGVLEPGAELDHERERVEVVLTGAGMVLAELS